MARRRLGVVLLVPSPVGEAVDGLRRAFSDPMLEQVAPHITLVPPVNVAETDLAAALARLRAAAAQTRPLELTLGPVTSFEGDEGVAYLAVDGTDPARAALTRLRDRLLVPPLQRVIDHDFVPHVTVTQGADPRRLATVLAASVGWSPVAVRLERVHLLEEQHRPEGRRWVPIADVALAPARIVGRGGLELELTAGRHLDPEAAARLARVDEAADGQPDATGTEPASAAESDPRAEPLVVVARREGQVVGVTMGWTWGPTGQITRAWLDPEVADQGVDQHLGAAVTEAALQRGASLATDDS